MGKKIGIVAETPIQTPYLCKFLEGAPYYIMSLAVRKIPNSR
jgi:hypothetical protein